MEQKSNDLSSIYFDEVEKFTREHKINASHGIEHFMAVLNNTTCALDVTSLTMTERTKLLVKLASLMYDIDDHKYFPENHNFENARKILTYPL